MNLFRSTSDPSRRDGREESVPSTILHEAILASSSSVRDSLPEQHRAHFETLRQEIIDFAQAHGIPRESLANPMLSVRQRANFLFLIFNDSPLSSSALSISLSKRNLGRMKKLLSMPRCIITSKSNMILKSSFLNK